MVWWLRALVMFCTYSSMLSCCSLFSVIFVETFLKELVENMENFILFYSTKPCGCWTQCRIFIGTQWSRDQCTGKIWVLQNLDTLPRHILKFKLSFKFLLPHEVTRVQYFHYYVCNISNSNTWVRVLWFELLGSTGRYIFSPISQEKCIPFS